MSQPLQIWDQARNNSDSFPGAPVLIEVTRGALVESIHRGWIAVVDAEGEVIAGQGEIEARTFYRSAAKPFQAVPLIVSGAADHYRISPSELAVITGSHSGESMHLAAVKSILDKIGLSEAALQCGAHMPFDDATARQLRAEGRHAEVLHNNCSGKHAGMLALALFRGAPIENYLDPEHPIQREIRAEVARFSGTPAEEIVVAVDGCSAPVFGVSLKSMARSYARLVNPPAGMGAAARRIVAAMIDYPEMVGGSRHRLDTDLMRALPGRIVSKVGAEGVQLLGVLPCPRYPAGLGIAIKIEDGDIRRARDPVVIETLRQLELLDRPDLERLSPYSRAKVYNHRRLEVGEVRPTFRLV